MKNDQTGKCEDIDECEGTDVTCNMETQACYNTPGSYKCLDILPVGSTPRACPNGFKFDEKIKQCLGDYWKWLTYALGLSTKNSKIAALIFLLQIQISMNVKKILQNVDQIRNVQIWPVAMNVSISKKNQPSKKQ